MGKHCGDICTFIVQVWILCCSSLFTALLHFTELGGHSILLLRSQLNFSSSLLQGGWGDVESLSCWLITVEQMDSLLLEEFTVRVLWFIQKHLSNSRWFHCVPLERDPCHSTVISININIVIEVRESGLYLRSVASFLWCFFFSSPSIACTGLGLTVWIWWDVHSMQDWKLTWIFPNWELLWSSVELHKCFCNLSQIERQQPLLVRVNKFLNGSGPISCQNRQIAKTIDQFYYPHTLNSSKIVSVLYHHRSFNTL